MARATSHRYAKTLTFEVYNLYPDYVYPGRIIRVDIQVDGEPEEDKKYSQKLKFMARATLDSAHHILRFLVKKALFEDVWLSPIDSNGQRFWRGIFFGGINLNTLCRKWLLGTQTRILLWDANGNERHSQTDFGWKLYINNPLEDCRSTQRMSKIQ